MTKLSKKAELLLNNTTELTNALESLLTKFKASNTYYHENTEEFHELEAEIESNPEAKIKWNFDNDRVGEMLPKVREIFG